MIERLRGSLERRIGHGRYGTVVGACAGVWSFLEYNLSPAGRRSARRIRELRRTYAGQRCFIIGNGPSLRGMDLSPLRDEVTFGLNRIYLLFEELGFSTTFLVSINRLVLEQAAQEVTAVDSTVFLNWWSRHHVPPERDPAFLRVTSARPRFSTAVDRGLWAGATVTFAALQLAYYMGFEEVILIGVDHSFAEKGRPNEVVESSGPDRDHFDPQYFGKGFRWQLPDLEMSERAYELARRAYERAGRRVLDATVDGKLEVFPKVDFTSLFDSRPIPRERVSPARNLKALAVIHYPVYGGPPNRYTKIGPLLAEAGVELTMLTPDEPGDAAARLREAGLDVVSQRLGRFRSGGALGANARMLASLPGDVAAIRRLLRERSIDVVMVNGLVNPHAAVAARLEGVPVVWLLLDTYSSPLVRRLFRPIVLRLADVIMSTGRSVASAHLGAAKLGERLVFFFPPVDVDGAFAPNAERRRAARAELGLSEETLVVGNVANLTPMKGHLTFIRAAAELGATHPDARFVVLGAGYEYRGEYTRSLHDEVARLGLADRLDFRDPGSRVADLAPAIDVFWMPSRPNSEGIPTAIGEAMSLEQPVVASRVGSIDEAVEAGVTGALVVPDDAAVLAAATIPYLDEPALRREAGRVGRERARRLYSLQACADAHIRALDLAVKQRAGR